MISGGFPRVSFCIFTIDTDITTDAILGFPPFRQTLSPTLSHRFTQITESSTHNPRLHGSEILRAVQ